MASIKDSLEKYKDKFIEFGPYLVIAFVAVMSVIKGIEYGTVKIYGAIVMFCIASFAVVFLLLLITDKRIDNIKKRRVG